METQVTSKAHKVLFFNTLAFIVCFAVWTLNGVLVTFLVDNGIFKWGAVEIGWLLGIPILTGSIFRLPIGIMTDKFGGKWVFGFLLLFCALPVFLLSFATGFWSFAMLSFGYGMTGTGFAVGIAYTSVWYPKQWQGTALGIFGAGNAGAALTTLLAPTLLKTFTNGGQNPDGWRMLPYVYAAALLVTGVLFLLFTENKKPSVKAKSLREMMQPLRSVRVWRFGLYYFLVFGCFVAFAQWLVPYFVNVYSTSLVMAGLFASSFSLPSGVIRALGGWMSDHWGARRVMYWVLGTSTIFCFLLVIPKMEIVSPGQGVQALKPGKVTLVTENLIKVDDKEYPLKPSQFDVRVADDNLLILPTKESWQAPVVKVGDAVVKKQLLAKGSTCIYFQANMWIYLFLVTVVGIVWGIGKAAVYKYIPEYFPNEVGVVGGMVGVLGGLGGFCCPILFGYLLQSTGLWTSCWMLMFLLSLGCLMWMHRTVSKIQHKAAPHMQHHFEHEPSLT
ncbi:MAG: MFS transporter [Blastocatellia bacterium]|nr:MFS transporter [Blastocatellia bacterium]